MVVTIPPYFATVLMKGGKAMSQMELLEAIGSIDLELLIEAESILEQKPSKTDNA